MLFSGWVFWTFYEYLMIVLIMINNILWMISWVYHLNIFRRRKHRKRLSVCGTGPWLLGFYVNAISANCFVENLPIALLRTLIYLNAIHQFFYCHCANCFVEVAHMLMQSANYFVDNLPNALLRWLIWYRVRYPNPWMGTLSN